MLKNIYLGIKFSFSYFSILPMPFKNSDDLSQKNILAMMLLFFPLVGLVLGLGATLLYSFLESLSWLGAIISALLYMVLYGFLHTEAIIDVADAIYASHSGKDAYSIIKEPTVGAMGVLFAIAVVLLKVSTIVYLFMHGFFLEFLSILMLSRLSLVFLFKVHTFRSSFANTLKDSLTNYHLLFTFIVTATIGLFLTSSFILLLFIALPLALFISYAIKSKIGFVNGDVLGATLEGVEILLFILVVKGVTL